MEKKIFLKISLVFIVAIIIVCIMSVKSNAASLSISTSKSSVSVGESYTVTVTLSNGAGYVSSGGKTEWLDNSSFSYTKTAGSGGSETISASGTAADYTTEEDQPVYATKTVTIIQPKQETVDPAVVDTTPAKNPGNTSAQKPAPVKTKEEEKKSSEASLGELVIAEGEITPEFSTDVYEYTLNVPNEITALNITATPLDNKATVTIEGNENFVIGENKVIIKVVAEDGTTKEYTINVIRKRSNLLMQSLKITYIDKDGNVQELELNPNFDSSILEYKLADISYLINSLDIEAIANLEGAIVEITGNDNLQEGENKIVIKLTMKAEQAEEGEEQEADEVVIYTITVNKEKEPTLWEKIKNKIKGIFGGVFIWYNNNQGKVVMYALCACVIALVGLSVYIVVDYNKYKTLVAKLKKLEQINSQEPIKETPIQGDIQIAEESNIEIKKGGKHF